MTEKMSTTYLLALLSDRVDALKTLIKQARKQDRECKDWDGCDADMLINLLDWLKALSDKRRDGLLKSKGKNPQDFAL